MALALAVDIGGTKIAAAVVDDEGRLVASHRTPTPDSRAGASADEVAGAVLATAEAAWLAADRPEVLGVGVGCAGPMRLARGEVSPVNIPAWRGFPLRDLIADRFAGVPVRMHNDTVCMALGEHWRGAGQGHRSLLGMVVSTGVGGGVIVEGRVLGGSGGNAGHVGHIVADPLGPACPCGGRGCVEAIASGPSIARWALDNGWAAPEVSEPTAEAVAADARVGHPVASEAFTRAGRALGVGIASALATLDVEAVVIGGGVAQAGDLLFGPLREALGTYARLPFTRDVPVMRAGLGGDAGLVGAAALVLSADAA